MTTERAGWWLIGLGGLLIALLTLGPEAGNPILPQWCLKCGSLWLADGMLNALVFLPLGAGLALVAGPFRGAALGAASSIAIEVLQRFVIPGRYASLGDIVSNTAGAVLGGLVAVCWIRMVHPRARLARVLSLGSGAAWLLTIGFFNWTMQPDIPQRPLWGQWAADLPHLARFPGRLLTGTLGEQPFPWSRVADSHRLRAQLLADQLTLAALVVPDGETRALAPILSIFDQAQWQVLLLGQDGRDAVLQMRTRASDVGLWSAEAVLDRAFPAGGVGAPLLIEASRAGPLMTLRAAAPAGTFHRSSETRLGPALGWTLLLPPSHAPALVGTLLTASWIGLLLLLPAYWTGATRCRGQAVIMLAVALAGMVLLPRAQSVSIPPPSTWLVGGILAGAAWVAGWRYGAAGAARTTSTPLTR